MPQPPLRTLRFQPSIYGGRCFWHRALPICYSGLAEQFNLPPQHNLKEIQVRLYARPGECRVALTQISDTITKYTAADWRVHGGEWQRLDQGIKRLLDRMAKKHQRTTFYAEIWYVEYA